MGMCRHAAILLFLGVTCCYNGCAAYSMMANNQARSRTHAFSVASAAARPPSRTLLHLSNNKSDASPDHHQDSSTSSPAPREKLPQVLSPKLFFGMIGYAVALSQICKKGFLTSGWLASVTLLSVSAVGMSGALLPLVQGHLKVGESLFPVVLGAHLTSASALPIITTMLWHLVENDPHSRFLLLASMVAVGIGSVAEIVAHFIDCWVFRSGGHASDGVENIVFSVGLVAGFGLLTASLLPAAPLFRRVAALLAFLSPAMLIGSAPLWMEWKKAKGLVYASQGLTSASATVVLCQRLQSYWPIMYMVQSWNVVRNAKLIQKTDVQSLHILPSVYGWFSYVFPIGLALTRPTSSLVAVAVASLMTVVVSDRVESKMVQLFQV